MKKELSRRNGARIAAELMKLLGGRLSAVMLPVSYTHLTLPTN